LKVAFHFFFFPDTKVTGEKFKFKLSFNHDKRKCKSSVQKIGIKETLLRYLFKLAFTNLLGVRS